MSESTREDRDKSREAASEFTLTGEMIERVIPYGTEELVEQGATLFEQGSRSSDFFVVLHGLIELSGQKQSRLGSTNTTLTRGQFSGELDLLSGRKTLLHCRAVRKCQMLRIQPAPLRRLLRTELDIADLLMRGWIARRASLVNQSEAGAIIIGRTATADTMRMQQFLVRNGYPNKLIEPEQSTSAELLLASMNLDAKDLPVVFLPGNRVFKNPTNEVLADETGHQQCFRGWCDL